MINLYLVSYDPVSNGEELLDLLPLVDGSLLRAPTQPRDHPRKEIGRYPTEATASQRNIIMNFDKNAQNTWVATPLKLLEIRIRLQK